MRALLVRRLLCTSFFSSQSRPSSAAIAAASANLNSDQAAAEPSTTLFVHGLNKRTTPETLHEAFSKFGQVVTANIITERASGFSKGYGFVGYATLDDAEKGMKGMNTQSIDGWVIFAEYAKPKRY